MKRISVSEWTDGMKIPDDNFLPEYDEWGDLVGFVGINSGVKLDPKFLDIFRAMRIQKNGAETKRATSLLIQALGAPPGHQPCENCQGEGMVRCRYCDGSGEEKCA